MKIRIYTANSVSKALEILKTAVIDVVVTELNMPGVSGYALPAWMDKTYPHIPVIVMSACPRDAMEGQLTGLRFADYIEKPLDLQSIAKSILKVALRANRRTNLEALVPKDHGKLQGYERLSMKHMTDTNSYWQKPATIV